MTLQRNERRSAALQLVLLLGLVSAFGDITYESARSVSGPYLAALGAGAGIIGLVSGLGEFLGYALRLLAGYVADRTSAYWWVKEALLMYSGRVGSLPSDMTVNSNSTILTLRTAA